ncbi:MAG: HlyD family type I secretion periplasmic adaptor subunit [bacterium]
MSTEKPLPLKPLKDKSTFIAFIICLIGAGGFLLWALFAPLAEGVTASGQIVVEDNRKAVQHLEGGIISKLNIKEGDIVERGQVLLELEQVSSLASRDEIANDLATQLASLVRLNALLEDAKTLDFSSLANLPITAEARADIINRQSALFIEQRESHETELSVLRARRATLITRERDLTGQIEAVARALNLAREDLQRKQSYIQKGWVTLDQLQASQREVANLEAEVSRLRASQNEARVSSREILEETKNTKAQFRSKISADLLEARSRSAINEERLASTQDVLTRTVITAPRSGKVLNLAFTTIGGVVRPGEKIMEIVPKSDGLIASVQISPTDREAVHQGQKVEAQLSAYQQFDVPRISGEVLSISADLKNVPETGVSYYEARILLDLSTLESNRPVEVIPGMPVNAFINSGHTRTFADMVAEPLQKTFTKGTIVH